MIQTAKDRVMIVGGNVYFLSLMRRYVRTSKLQIFPANLGDDVLSLARSENPVAIVLEVDRPDTIGWHILHELKTDPIVASIPVIVCSWLEEETRSLAEGADIYLRMPILYADFGAALTASLMKVQNEEDS